MTKQNKPDEQGDALTAADELAEIAGQGNCGMPPAMWAYYFGMEHVERNTGPDYPVLTPSQQSTLRTVAEGQIMRTFDAQADTLPLSEAPLGLRWPKGQPLPPKWREGLYMTKVELRAWAKEHAQELLGSALLAEPAPESAPAVEAATIAEQGTDKTMPDWRDEARRIVTEIHNRHLKIGMEGTLSKYAETVANALRNEGIRGPNGWLSAGTVKREALTGKQWWQIRPRSLPPEDTGSVGNVGNVGSIDAG
ncbi:MULTISPECIES: hypothetical protein [unclassified Thiomonas]|jgi:hypothetical protein|uniref:hypothetical protein n=1 Tax=unclassified Thiomonas TaxID=2625466 RepID=UPI0004DBACC7|nr:MULTISPECIES: hypothetical protein [unclassified Thiomonas]CDW95285.1 hypothetical protein THICB2_640126 [Thiomonas sp. CB2]VDY03706.1 protein of unknown function [Thiomonas sp. Bio17B3]VDY09118.1 protein of unknown function [Thiomonas sp. Sup16B3]VDY11955.1 conserved protein of unknown function [Thiomonas sp. OC7]VDY18828.1 protein of unknown function [Thiomonas sp. CB2]